MKTIQLTKGKEALVDDDDYIRVSSHSWHALCIKGKWYAQSRIGYRLALMHRFLLNPPSVADVDHRDNDGLNNQRENLRICTRSQNLMNKRARPHSSQFKGVFWQKNRCKWLAQICADKRVHYLGYFLNEESAARAYDVAAQRLHGQFAVLNFPDREEG